MIFDAQCWAPRNLRDTLRDCVSSEELNYLYVPLGKAANTAIKHFLLSAHKDQGLYSGPTPQKYLLVHALAAKETGVSKSPWRRYGRDEIEQFLEHFDKRFTFSVVRNPYTRLLSGYLDKITKKQEDPANITTKFNLPSFPTNFSEFVDMVVEQSDMECNIHWTSQTYRLCLPFLKFDFLGFFESLDDALGRVALQIGAPGKEAQNDPAHQTGADDKLNEFYDKSVARKVFGRYERDFELLGYSEDFHTSESTGVTVKYDGEPYKDLLAAVAVSLTNGRAGLREKVGGAQEFARMRGDTLIFPDSAKVYATGTQ